MEAVSKIQAKNALAPKDVTWSISNYTMTFDQARAYCYSRGDWLANPENFNELATGVILLLKVVDVVFVVLVRSMRSKFGKRTAL